MLAVVGGACQTDGMNFRSLYAHGFARVAAVTHPVALADPTTNAARVLDVARELHDQGVAAAVFPELDLTGYSIDDLVFQDVLLDDVLAAIKTIVDGSEGLTPVLAVGAPLRKGARLFNCAVVIKDGEVLGVVPKSHLPTYKEFYEKRWYAPGLDQRGQYIDLGDLGEVPFGPDLIFRAVDLPDLAIHVEICEDVWVPIPPSSEAAAAGASVLMNLSGSPITIGKSSQRSLVVQSQSFRTLAAYVYAASGEGESTTDLAWDGQTMIYDQGTLLAESERFPSGPRTSIADVDLGAIRQARMRFNSYDDNRPGIGPARPLREVPFELGAPDGDRGLLREIERFPFVPADDAQLAQDCYEAYEIQVSGLEQRMRSIGAPKIVIGVSGGLDSTHALIVAARAMDRVGRPRTDILAYTMPGFATSDHTKSSAYKLAEALGVTFEEVDIRPMATQMLKDMGHPAGSGEPVYDVTFENVQAGLRTDFLFRIANQKGGIVLGTGDLSELALGWCTYGVGDQMSHYGVNAGVPKTLMQHLIRWVASGDEFSDAVGETLLSILDTEISPELVPTKEGEKPQSTQDSIGPYNLQDFTLYHVLTHGARPSKIAFLAMHAWQNADEGRWPSGFPDDERPAYSLAEIKKWLEVFHKRFFSQQFKRSALPNGPKVSAGGALSPRGDWRMPSDASSRAWLAELERNIPNE